MRGPGLRITDPFRLIAVGGLRSSIGRGRVGIGLLGEVANKVLG